MKTLWYSSAVAALLLCLLVDTAGAERVDNLTKAVAKEAGINEQQAEQQVRGVFTAIQSELDAGREVTIRRFGRFWLQERGQRQGRNPKTGAALQIPAKRYPKFTSSDVLKDSMNEGEQPKSAAVESQPAPAAVAATK